MGGQTVSTRCGGLAGSAADVAQHIDVHRDAHLFAAVVVLQLAHVGQRPFDDVDAIVDLLQIDAHRFDAAQHLVEGGFHVRTDHMHGGGCGRGGRGGAVRRVAAVSDETVRIDL